MKILLINKFHYPYGGSEAYYFAQAEAFAAKGHEVVFFAMQDERNLQCAQEKYFVSNVDYVNDAGMIQKIKAGFKLVYSFEAKHKMERLIQDEKPDIAHIGLIHRQLTLSIVDVMRKHHIPIVMTMHDLIFGCPCYTMLRQGRNCQLCVTGSLWNCIRGRCIKDSYGKSLLGVIEAKFLSAFKYYDKIDLYIAECAFYRKLMIESGFTKSPVIHKPNFLPVEQTYGFHPQYGDYILYFGRFTKEKGMMTLLDAQRRLKSRYPMKIVGKGPMQEEMQRFIKEAAIDNVELPGAIYSKEMDAIIQGARIVVMPSEWYENCPYALLQAIAKGKIVIASRIGGLPELIKDGKTGYLFEPGNAQDLADKIATVMNMDSRAYSQMSREIAKQAQKKYSWEPYIDELVAIYEKLILDSRGKRLPE